MLWRLFSRAIFIPLIAALGAGAFGGTVYDESVSGDLSNSGLSPTSLGTLNDGANDILGSTGRGTNGVDTDYFVVTVPTGSVLSSITVLPGTQGGGTGLSFIGVEAGSQVTVPTTATTAAGLLGWAHYSPADINTDILPRMGISTMGSDGFTPPLKPGQYASWIQELSADPPGTAGFSYGFDLDVSAVPEPGSFVLAILVLILSASALRAPRFIGSWGRDRSLAA
jgi:hypothetical protein